MTTLRQRFEVERVIADSAIRGAKVLRKTYTVWGYDYESGVGEIWDKLKTVRA